MEKNRWEGKRKKMEWHIKPNVGDHQRARGVSDERGEDRHLNPQWEKQNDFRRREQRRKAEARGEVSFFCHLLLMWHMWEATETMSHSHNATVATIGSEQPLSVKDNYVSACHLATDFSPVIEWLFTVYPPCAVFWTAPLWHGELNRLMFVRAACSRRSLQSSVELHCSLEAPQEIQSWPHHM